MLLCPKCGKISTSLLEVTNNLELAKRIGNTFKLCDCAAGRDREELEMRREYERILKEDLDKYTNTSK